MGPPYSPTPLNKFTLQNSVYTSKQNLFELFRNTLQFWWLDDIVRNGNGITYINILYKRYNTFRLYLFKIEKLVFLASYF